MCGSLRGSILLLCKKKDCLLEKTYNYGFSLFFSRFKSNRPYITHYCPNILRSRKSLKKLIVTKKGNNTCLFAKSVYLSFINVCPSIIQWRTSDYKHFVFFDVNLGVFMIAYHRLKMQLHSWHSLTK